MTFLKRFSNYIRSIDRVWLIAWILIYVGFLLLDAYSHLRYGDATIEAKFAFFGRDFIVPVISGGTFIGTTILKYTGIALNFVYAHFKFPKDHLLQIALGFTLLADTVLCIDSVSALGVLVFCFAQYFHTARLSGAEPNFLLFYTSGLVVILFLGRLLGIPSIFVVGFGYAILLLTNLVLAFRWQRRAKDALSRTRSTSALAGFILFVCCDLCVAMSFFSFIGFLPAFFYAPANYFSWAFYYISQLLIANSSVPTRKFKKSAIFVEK